MTKATPELDIYQDGDDLLRQKLKYKILEQKDKLFYSIAESYGSVGAAYKGAARV